MPVNCKLAWQCKTKLPRFVAFFLLQAMKLEVQTHCRIALLIEPTWHCGKAFRYISGKKDIFKEMASKSTESDIFVATTLETMKGYEENVEKEPSCQVCLGGKEISAWVGCGHRDKGVDGCEYWVHQMCIGLKYSDEKKLKSVPYFCPFHMMNAWTILSVWQLPMLSLQLEKVMINSHKVFTQTWGPKFTKPTV